MKVTTQQELCDIDRATLLWFKEDREDWEWLEAIALFKKYSYWIESTQEPDLHKMKHSVQ